MESLGQYLKTQRELREVSMRDISNETKIGLNWLEAMETDNWDAIPCETFARGFLRSYAKSLGLEAEEVVAMYDDLKHSSKPQQEADKSCQTKSSHKSIWLLGAVIVIAVAAAIVIWVI